MADVVVSILGTDRPGVLDDMCGVVQGNHGTITDLRVIDTGGHFAMLSTVQIDDLSVSTLRTQFAEFAVTSGLTVRIDPVVCQGSKSCHTYHFVASTDDYAALLKQVAHLLRVLRINIEDIHTDVGTSLKLTLGVPKGCPVNQLREYLTQLLGPMTVEWKLSAA